MKPMRTLYECSHARVQGIRIYCDRGYPLTSKTGEVDLDVRMLAEGKALATKSASHAAILIAWVRRFLKKRGLPQEKGGNET